MQNTKGKLPLPILERKKVVPDKNSLRGKKEQIEEMFDEIASQYDLLNRVLSLRTDKRWRKKVRKELAQKKPGIILDMATGTGELAIELIQLHPEKIYAVDLSKKMLDIAQQKVQESGLESIIEVQKGDAENLSFENDFFDAITVAFGVRNFENLEKGLQEFFRVLKRNGTLVILEISKVKTFPLKQLFHFYFHYWTPRIGKMLSKSEKAYSYLPNSVKHFPEGEEMCLILKKTGFKNVVAKRLSFGIATLYICEK